MPNSGAQRLGPARAHARTVAEQLVHDGHEVRLLTRSGSGPQLPGLERRAVDVRDEPALRAALDGAQALFACTHAAYSSAQWQAELPATEQSVLRAAGDRVVVFPESLYAYSAPQAVTTEDRPSDVAGGKRGIRATLLAARAASPTPTVSVVASDFYGPLVRTAHAGERMVPAVLAGRRMRVLGSADQPHSFTYVPDLARAMVAAAQQPPVPDRVLHAPTGPALTQRALVEAFAAEAGRPARVGTLPSWLVRAGALVPWPLRELAEVLYQFEEPFVMSSARSEQALGLLPTPLPEAVRATVAWRRAQEPARI